MYEYYAKDAEKRKNKILESAQEVYPNSLVLLSKDSVYLSGLNMSDAGKLIGSCYESCLSYYCIQEFENLEWEIVSFRLEFSEDLTLTQFGQMLNCVPRQSRTVDGRKIMTFLVPRVEGDKKDSCHSCISKSMIRLPVSVYLTEKSQITNDLAEFDKYMAAEKAFIFQINGKTILAFPREMSNFKDYLSKKGYQLAT
jgi:hypothetical protein